MKMNNFLKVGVFAYFLVFALSSCNKSTTDSTILYSPEIEAKETKAWLDLQASKNKTVLTTSTGLQYILEKEGTGATIKAGNVVTVIYTGMFLNGTIFDSSLYSGNGTFTYIHKSPTDANLTMIKGWEEGVEALNTGAIATLLIPSAKGYGVTGSGSIPPYTALLFKIEVIKIK
jgi:FKBP-type peptidyl-prolyl cis-trans isomerase